MTEDIYARLKRHEGFTPVPMPDAHGMDVVGYGHDLTPEEAALYAGGMGEAEAETLLHEDVAKARAEIARDLPWTADLSPFRQDILTEMAFQLGMDGVLGFHNFLFCLRSGDYVGACRNMLEGDTPTGMSEWYNETPDRCTELSRLMEAGQ